MFGYLDKAIRALVLTMPKRSGYVKIFNVKEGDNKLMSFRIDDEKLLEKYKAIWTRVEYLKNIKLNAKKKITFGDKVCTNFRMRQEILSEIIFRQLC